MIQYFQVLLVSRSWAKLQYSTSTLLWLFKKNMATLSRKFRTTYERFAISTNQSNNCFLTEQSKFQSLSMLITVYY